MGSIMVVLTTQEELVGPTEEAFGQTGVAPDRIGRIFEGGQDDTARVAAGEVQAVLVLTSPRGPDFVLPLEAYDGLILGYVHNPETYTSTGHARCHACVRDGAVAAEELEQKDLADEETLLANPVYLDVVRACVEGALQRRPEHTELRDVVGKKDLNRALGHPEGLRSLAVSEALVPIFVKATQERLEREMPG